MPALTQLTAGIVSAYLSTAKVQATEVPDLIRTVHRTLAGIDKPAPEPAAVQEPAVPIRKSITADALICLEDGKRLKMLKRYLRTRYNMTPAEYRAKWGLPPEYPMVAPNYAALRSEHAQRIGLGTTTKAAGPGRGKKKPA